MRSSGVFEYFVKIQRDVVQLNLRVLFSTNASNVGIDDSKITFGIRYEWPRDLATYFQERGRLSRILGTASRFILMAGLGSFEYLMAQILTSDVTSTNSAAAAEVNNLQQQMVGANSMISPLRRNAEQNAQRRTGSDHILKKAEKKRLFEHKRRELLEVITFFAQTADVSIMLGQSICPVVDFSQSRTQTAEPCKDRYAICTKQWHKQYLSIYKHSLILFFSRAKVES